MRKILGLAGSALASLALAACTAHFPAEHVKTLDATALKVPGIYYALPKTTVGIEIPIEYTKYEGGELKNVEACVLEERAACSLEDVKASEYSLRPAVLTEKPVPDMKQVYRVSPNFSAFMSQSHSFSNGEFGYLNSATSSGTNQTGNVLLTLAKTVAPVFNFAWISESSTEIATSLPEKTSIAPRFSKACSSANEIKIDLLFHLVKKELEAGTNAYSKDLAMLDATCIVNVLNQQKVLLQTALKEQKKSLEPESLRGMPKGYAEALTKQLALNVATRTAELQGIKERLHVVPTKTVISTSLVLAKPWEITAAALPEPADSAPCVGKKISKGWLVIDRECWRPRAVVAVNAEENISALEGFFATRAVAVRARPLDEKAAELAADEPASGVALGYRYRLPAQARLEVAVLDLALPDGICASKPGWCAPKAEPKALCDKNKELCGDKSAYSRNWLGAFCKEFPNECEPSPVLVPSWVEVAQDPTQFIATVVADELMSIAQFGPVVSLPESFSGSNVNVELTLTKTGAMSNIKLSQVARDGAAAGDLLTSIADAKAKRDTARQQAPLEDIKRSNDLIEQQIRQLRAQRCRAALAGLADGAETPMECKD